MMARRCDDSLAVVQGPQPNARRTSLRCDRRRTLACPPRDRY
jgi:hypothetical protein